MRIRAIAVLGLLLLAASAEAVSQYARAAVREEAERRVVTIAWVDGSGRAVAEVQIDVERVLEALGVGNACL